MLKKCLKNEMFFNVLNILFGEIIKKIKSHNECVGGKINFFCSLSLTVWDE